MRRVGVLLVASAALLAAAALALVGVGDRAGALSDWQAFVLGVVQGLTELLPISSSGHLILVPWLADWEFLKRNDEFNQTFDVALHLGALGEELIADRLGEPWQIATLLAVFAVVLWVADRTQPRREPADLGFRGAITLGLAQTLALAPGVSRSGVTISAARFLGLDREAAANVSFLLLVPITLGAVMWKGLTDVLLGDLPAGWVGPFVVGPVAAAGSGLVAIWGLLEYVRRHDYSVFVVYRLAAAAFVLLLIATGVREAGF